jgi:hypothetical protein
MMEICIAEITLYLDIGPVIAFHFMLLLKGDNPFKKYDCQKGYWAYQQGLESKEPVLNTSGNGKNVMVYQCCHNEENKGASIK